MTAVLQWVHSEPVSDCIAASQGHSLAKSEPEKYLDTKQQITRDNFIQKLQPCIPCGEYMAWYPSSAGRGGCGEA